MVVEVVVDVVGFFVVVVVEVVVDVVGFFVVVVVEVVVVVVMTGSFPATFLYVARAISGYLSLSLISEYTFLRRLLLSWSLPIFSRTAAAIARCPFWLGWISPVSRLPVWISIK